MSSSRKAVDQSGMSAAGTTSSRVELINWINQTCGTNIKKLDETANGVIACTIIDQIHPNVIPLKRLNYNAHDEYENLKNYKLLQAAFSRLDIPKNLDMGRLSKGRPQETIDFLQWLFVYYSGMTGENEFDVLNPLMVSSAPEPVNATPRSRVPKSTPRSSAPTAPIQSVARPQTLATAPPPRSIGFNRPKLGVPIRAIGANRGAGLVEEDTFDEMAEQEQEGEGDMSGFSRSAPVIPRVSDTLSRSIKLKPSSTTPLQPVAVPSPLPSKRPPVTGGPTPTQASKSWSSLRTAVRGADVTAPLPSLSQRSTQQPPTPTNTAAIKELTELKEDVKKLRSENQSINSELQSLYTSFNELAEKHHSLQQDHELSNKDVDFYYNKLVAVESSVKNMVLSGETHPVLEKILTIMYQPEVEKTDGDMKN